MTIVLTQHDAKQAWVSKPLVSCSDKESDGIGWKDKLFQQEILQMHLKAATMCIVGEEEAGEGMTRGHSLTD